MREKKEDIDQTRRKFLIGLGYAAVGALGESASRHGKKMEESVGFLNRLLTYFRSRTEVKPKDRPQIKNEEDEITEKEVIAENNLEEVAIDQKVKKEDSASLREIISFNSREPITLGEGEVERLKKYWEKRYEGDKKGDLEGALTKLKGWEEISKKEFMQVGKEHSLREIKLEKRRDFLEKFAECFYLSIPESYWNLEAKSSANAVGPFQFTEKTADLFDLKKGANFDERIDPVKSAHAAALCLLDLHKNMNQDWRLALSGYNGGFVWKFKKEAVANKKDLNYTNFLQYLAKKIEKLRQELLSAKTLTHEVLKGDTPEKIATMYGMTVKQLENMNKYKKLDSLEPEDKLIIIPTMENRQKNFYYHIEGFSQNINYPAKLDAVLSVLRKKEKETGMACFDQKTNLPNWKAEIVKQVDPYFSHAVTSKDTLSSLAKKYAISLVEICQKNNLKKPLSIIPGKNPNHQKHAKTRNPCYISPRGENGSNEEN